MKSAHIDENNQALDTIVITVPDGAQMINNNMTPNIDNDFIMLDDVNQCGVNQSDVEESLNQDINNIFSKTINNVKEPQKSTDVIIIDDDDDDDVIYVCSFNKDDSSKNPSRHKRLEKCQLEQSMHRSINKVKRLAFPIIPLDKLFFCKECSKYNMK